MRFEWDDKKAAANRRKHGVSFDEAVEVFDDPNLIGHEDAEHSRDEPRFVVIGYSAIRLLLVVFTERRGGVVRIISARLPTPSERKLYESQNG
ncbi:MAG: BrnT family toxin [Pyrinomonadaceae bacterium]